MLLKYLIILHILVLKGKLKSNRKLSHKKTKSSHSSYCGLLVKLMALEYFGTKVGHKQCSQVPIRQLRVKSIRQQ